MFWFKRKKKIEKENPVQERIANKIVAKWIWMQERWAAYMQKWFERFSLRGKKVLLGFVCTLFGGYSFYLVAKNVTGPNKITPTITPIKAPSHVLKTGEPKRLFNADAEYKKIEEMKHYRDSIVKIYKTK